MERTELSYQEAIGRLIQKRREALKMSQYKLADKSGVSRNTVRRIEDGEISAKITDILRICDALGLSLLDISLSCLQPSDPIVNLLNLLSKFDPEEQEQLVGYINSTIAIFLSKINALERSSSKLVPQEKKRFTSGTDI